MNEPLKFKLFSVYGKILHKDVLTEAFRKVEDSPVLIKSVSKCLRKI